MFKTAKQFFPILQQSETLIDIIQLPDILHSTRQPPNLKKILTKAKFTSNTEKPQVSKCEDPRCGTCPFIQTGQSITFKKRNEILCKFKYDMQIKKSALLYDMPYM
jgi:hypothetical protein